MYHLTKKGKGLFSMTLYKGQIKNQKRNGFGIQLFPNGCVYIGFWQENEPEGIGKLIIKDGTSYEGEYIKGFISKGCIYYFNEAVFEGEFDGTPFERFKSGVFKFKNKVMLKASWKDGFITNGILFEGNKEVANLDNKPIIIYSKGNDGVIISKKNKWIYEGGIKENRCNGNGVIYCTFQQYKSGKFLDDKINGESYKMSINWGEITKGNCEMDMKVGDWERIFNNGYQVYYNINDREIKVTFPYLNNDYYIGSVIFNEKKYGLTFKKGVYYSEKNKSVEKIEISNIEDIYQLNQIKIKGFDFSFTCKKIFENDFIYQMIKNYLFKLVFEKIITTKIFDIYFKEIIKEDLNNLNFTELEKSINNTKIPDNIAKSMVKSKKPPINNKKRAVTPNIKVRYNDEENSNLVEKKKTLEFSDYLNIKKNQLEINDDISPREFLSRDSDKLIESLNINDDLTNVFKKDIIRMNETVKTNALSKNIPLKGKDNTKQFKKVDSNLMQTKETKKALTTNPIKFDKIDSDNEDPPLVPQLVKDKTPKKSFFDPQVCSVENPLIDDPIEFFEGITKKGKFVGFCRVIYKSGLFIEANFSEGVLNGRGLMILNNGIEYRGFFKNGLLEGEGSIHFENKEYLGNFKEGNFKNDKIITGIDNTHFLFRNSEDRKKKTGVVNIYFKNGFKLIDCHVDKQQLLNEKCKLFNKEGEYWIGKIQKKKGYYKFESLTGNKQTFNIFFDSQGIIQMCA